MPRTLVSTATEDGARTFRQTRSLRSAPRCKPRPHGTDDRLARRSDHQRVHGASRKWPATASAHSVPSRGPHCPRRPGPHRRTCLWIRSIGSGTSQGPGTVTPQLSDSDRRAVLLRDRRAKRTQADCPRDAGVYGTGGQFGEAYVVATNAVPIWAPKAMSANMLGMRDRSHELQSGRTSCSLDSGS